MKVDDLLKILKEKKEKVSKANKVRSLIQKQKGLMRKKQNLTDFEEPVLFLVRQNGMMDIYEKATAGKFVFEHSNGNSRFIELRPSDQITFPYGDKRVRAYIANENRPYAGWDEPIVDGESVMLGYEKTKATDLKYQQAIQKLKNASKMTWVYIILALAGALVIAGFGYNTWIQPALAKRSASIASQAVPPSAGLIWLSIKSKFKRGLKWKKLTIQKKF